VKIGAGKGRKREKKKELPNVSGGKTGTDPSVAENSTGVEWAQEKKQKTKGVILTRSPRGKRGNEPKQSRKNKKPLSLERKKKKKKKKN